MLQPVIIALDFSSRRDVENFLTLFHKPLFLKIGMELYYQVGPDLVKMLKAQGHSIFLDLKLHDIPTTVHKAMRGLASLDVDLVNVHAAGGVEMMKRAVEGLEEGSQGDRPRCIGVTQLTSTSVQTMHHELNIAGSMEDIVSLYARNAKNARLDGVVCSPLEVPVIRSVCGDSFWTVTPGIRLEKEEKDDQKRVTTPERAKELGSDFIVVGRTITKAIEPVHVYEQIMKKWGH